MKSYLKLIRLPNVLMVGFTLVLMRYAIIAPILAVYSMQLQLPLLAFVAFVLATMLMAAAGYVVNDYYDRNLDLINRPSEDVVVGEKIPAKTALWLYRVLNAFSLILAAYASWKTGVFSLIVCYIVMMGLLYFYTTTYKKQLLVGNIIVGVATALVPVAAFLYEMPPVLSLYKYYIIAGSINVNVITNWILGFSLFAFFSGLAREIIKDMEDYEGDKIADRNTVPIVWGLNTARIIALALMFIVVAGIILVFIFNFIEDGVPDFYTLSYFTAFLVVPLGWNIYQLIKAKTVADFKFSGDLLKLIMLLGVLYAPLVWYIIHKTFGL